MFAEHHYIPRPRAGGDSDDVEPEPEEESVNGSGEDNSDDDGGDKHGSPEIPEPSPGVVAGTESDNDDSVSDVDSNISKETLELGAEIPENEVEMVSDGPGSSDPEPCSQVSSGWLGRAYNRESREQKYAEKKLDTNKKLTKDLLGFGLNHFVENAFNWSSVFDPWHFLDSLFEIVRNHFWLISFTFKP